MSTERWDAPVRLDANIKYLVSRISELYAGPALGMRDVERLLGLKPRTLGLAACSPFYVIPEYWVWGKLIRLAFRAREIVCVDIDSVRKFEVRY